MGIDFDSLKNIANDDVVDRAAEFTTSRFGEHADEIAAVAGRAKDFLAGESCGEPASNEGGGVTHTVPVKNFFFDDRSLDD
ncbi:antitoxin [Amycolatopsis sp. NPDC101161]|uniref:antitoxin n=1 Tax=Amycolatopsis sp. NPDC101161 TaxID=3363940 RepID=UPI00381F029D